MTEYLCTIFHVTYNFFDGENRLLDPRDGDLGDFFDSKFYIYIFCAVRLYFIPSGLMFVQVIPFLSLSNFFYRCFFSFLHLVFSLSLLLSPSLSLSFPPSFSLSFHSYNMRFFSRFFTSLAFMSDCVCVCAHFYLIQISDFSNVWNSFFRPHLITKCM